MGLSGAAVALPAPVSAAPLAAHEYRLDEFHIAGFQYHEGPGLIERLPAGTALRLVGEPENPYDDLAVRIEFEGHHIGYVPRVRNPPIFRLLSQSAPLRCVAAEVNAETVPWRAVWVTIGIVALREA